MDVGLAEPLDRGLARELRRLVLDHVTSEPRRVPPALLHVRGPGGAETVCHAADPAIGDHHLRVEVLQAMLRRVGALEAQRCAPAPLVWITRRGPLDLQDVDTAWLAAARAACGELDLALVMVVVDRHGWRDPRSGLERRWVRLRPRS